MYSNQGGDWEQRTLSTLSRFTNLMELKLVDSSMVLNDNILQCICRELSRLRVLHFGWSGEIADFGLTGEGRNGQLDSGVSLKNLEGLWELLIEKCGNITVGGLVKSVQFQGLRNAYLLSGVCLSDEQLVQIAKKNPSLEYLTRTMEDASERVCIFEKIKSVNARLTKVRSEHPTCLVQQTQPQPPVSYRPSYSLVGYSAGRFNMESIQTTTPHLANSYCWVPQV